MQLFAVFRANNCTSTGRRLLFFINFQGKNNKEWPVFVIFELF